MYVYFLPSLSGEHVVILCSYIKMQRIIFKNLTNFKNHFAVPNKIIALINEVYLLIERLLGDRTDP